jgi:predicted  nucleic acid-binding Zn-ribbon protein
MLPDLERLIRLQQIDTFLDGARRRVADHPALVEALDSKLAAANAAVAEAKQRVADNRAARATIEKDLSMVQTRLSKYRDQLMEVKTNKEYQAMQKEIEVAQQEVRRLEDLILERMIEADEVAAGLKEAEKKLDADREALARERKDLGEETERLRGEIERVEQERAGLAPQIPPVLLGTYDTLIRGRRGLAVVEARDYICTACHVRLRPQIFNEIRRGDVVHQCGSCQRILYYVPPPQAAAGETAPGAEAAR